MADQTAQLADQYTAAAESYERLWKPVTQPIGRRLLRELPLAEAERVLDIATGVGGLIPDLRAAAPAATVIGVDRSEGMLRQAQRLTRAPLALMDAESLGLRSASVDVALMVFCLFRLSRPRLGLEEALRVLRPGGTLGATTWGAESHFQAGDIWTEELDAHGAGPDPEPLIGQHAEVNSAEKLGELARQVGFEPVRAWAERFAHAWDLEGFIAVRTGYSGTSRRFATLDPEVQRRFLARLRERLALLPP